MNVYLESIGPLKGLLYNASNDGTVLTCGFNYRLALNFKSFNSANEFIKAKNLHRKVKPITL